MLKRLCSVDVYGCGYLGVAACWWRRVRRCSVDDGDGVGKGCCWVWLGVAGCVGVWMGVGECFWVWLSVVGFR